MKKSLTQTFLTFVSSFFVFSQLVFPILAATPVSAGANDITATDHEGQQAPSGTYSNGNTTEYSELDSINFRFTLSASDAATGQMQVEFSEDDGFCSFFDGSFNLGTHDSSAASVVGTSGATPTVTPVGTPTATAGEWIQLLDVSFPAAGEAIVNYYLTLSDEAGDCNGSSQHSRLGNSATTGDFANIGAQNVPVPAKDVLELPSLLITKNVDDDGDGLNDRNATTGEWEFTLDNGTPVPTDANGKVSFTSLSAGTHTLSENDVDGYSFYGSGFDCGDEVVAGVWTFNVTPTTDTDDIVCNFWNQRDVVQDPATVTVIKKIVNGPASPADFTLQLNDVQLTSGDVFTAEPGVQYFLSESSLPHYSQDYVVCTDNADPTNALLQNDPLVLEDGQDVTCTWVNSYTAPPEGTVTVIKNVINDNGGQATVADFDLYVGDHEVVSGETNAFPADQTYAVSEIQRTEGYVHESTVCRDADTGEYLSWTFRLSDGQNVTCVVTNNDVAPTLTLIKKVINDNLGQAAPQHFQLYADQIAMQQNTPTPVDGNQTYVIGEDQMPGYEHLSTVCWYVNAQQQQIPLPHPVPVGLGQNVTCVVTNNDLPPVAGSITVTKKVINENGGEAEPSDFLLFVNNTLVDSGVTGSFNPGQYTISEGPLVYGYTQQSITCYDRNNNDAEIPHPFILSSEDDVHCEVVNVDNAARITVFKDVINDDGGQAAPESFTLRVNNEIVAHNTNYTIPGGYQYTVTEDEYFGYEHVATQCFNLRTSEPLGWQFVVPAGADIGCMVVNDDIAPTLSVEKRVINDNGGREEPDDFDLTINEIEVDQHEVMTVAANQQYVVSEEDDHMDEYFLESVACYLVDEERQSLRKGGDLGNPVTPLPGQNVHCVVTNNDRGPVVIVEKETVASYENEQPFTFAATNNEEPFGESFTLSNGEQEILTGFTEGDITITESAVDGWAQYTIACYEIAYFGDGQYELLNDSPFEDDDNTDTIEMDLDLGESAVCRFVNVEFGSVEVTKFYDENKNGVWDDGEPTLEGFEMDLDADPADMYESHEYYGDHIEDRLREQVTDTDGKVVFEDLYPVPIAVYELSEDQEPDYELTALYCLPGEIYWPSERLANDVPSDDQPAEVEDEILVHVYPGQTTYCFVGNGDDPGGSGGGFTGDDDAALTIEKSNNRDEPVFKGETVTYTITVSVPEDSNCVYRELQIRERNDCEDDAAVVGPSDRDEVTVVDLPPEGFTYQPGSWTANSNVRGDLKAQGITAEPTYASPGEWVLTGPSSTYLVPGEVITLTYVALIDDDQAEGTYPDTAFVRGYTLGGDEILGNVHFSDTPFVGTQVEVLCPDEISGGFVLDVLAETGNPAILAPIAGALISASALLAGSGRRTRRLFKSLLSPLTGVFAALVITVSISSQALAAGFWTTNIATPSTFTNVADIIISYQVSATDAADEFEVTLLQDGTPIAARSVDTDYGDSGSFKVNLPGEGTFNFQTEVENVTQGNSANSNEVTVTYDQAAPEKPRFISVERTANIYTVRVEAPGGGPTELELFASTGTTIDFNAGNRVGTVSASSGETIEFSYSAPDGAQRYFAVVAVDEASNRSDAVGQTRSSVSVEGGVVDSDGDGVPDAQDPEPFNPNVTGQEETTAVPLSEDGETASATDENTDSNTPSDSSDGATIAVLVATAIAAGVAYLYSVRKKRATND